MWRRVVGMLAVGIGLCACGGSGAATPTTQAPASVPDTSPVTTSIPPTTTTTVAPPTTTSTTAAPVTTTTTQGAYFNLADTEALLSGAANPYESSALQWRYVKAQQDYEANTAGGFCNVALTNGEGEASTLVDNISFNCGLPLDPSSVTHAETDEAIILIAAAIKQYAGTDALSWFTSEAASAPVTTQRQFGQIMVSLNIGDGQSSVTVATMY